MCGGGGRHARWGVGHAAPSTHDVERMVAEDEDFHAFLSEHVYQEHRPLQADKAKVHKQCRAAEEYIGRNLQEDLEFDDFLTMTPGYTDQYAVFLAPDDSTGAE